MEKEKVLDIILSDKYYTISELRYNQKVGINFSKPEFDDFLETKDELAGKGFPEIIKLPLKTFNSKHCFFVKGKYLLSALEEYLQLFVTDYDLNQSSLFDRNTEEIIVSRLFSEIEGSLNIENIPTTHTMIEQIRKTDVLTETNDIIIKNMLDATEFIINKKPVFNKENLLLLYNILSKNALPDSLEIKSGEYYRHNKVYIGEFEGADISVINECMDSLFEFANDPLSISEYGCLLPFICHYYILYVHPYFDFNGRTARMVSFWLNYIHNIRVAPYFISEAINETKKHYYESISNTRLCRNDLTYFLGYILETSIKYSLVYKNLEEVKKSLSRTGDNLSPSDWVYLKKILAHNQTDYFNYKMFSEYINGKMSKQGALKILNNLASYNILECIKNKRNESMFRINPTIITYKYN